MTRINPSGWIDGDEITRQQLGDLDRKQADLLRTDGAQTIWINPDIGPLHAQFNSASVKGLLTLTNITTPSGGVGVDVGNVYATTAKYNSIIDNDYGAAVSSQIVPSTRLIGGPWAYSVVSVAGALYAGWLVPSNEMAFGLFIPSPNLSHGGLLTSVVLRFASTGSSGSRIGTCDFRHGSERLTLTNTGTSGAQTFSETITCNHAVDKNSGNPYWVSIAAGYDASARTTVLHQIELTYSAFGEPTWIRGGG